jgi:hypothetical protein
MVYTILNAILYRRDSRYGMCHRHFALFTFVRPVTSIFVHGSDSVQSPHSSVQTDAPSASPIAIRNRNRHIQQTNISCFVITLICQLTTDCVLSLMSYRYPFSRCGVSIICITYTCASHALHAHQKNPDPVAHPVEPWAWPGHWHCFRFCLMRRGLRNVKQTETPAHTGARLHHPPWFMQCAACASSTFELAHGGCMCIYVRIRMCTSDSSASSLCLRSTQRSTQHLPSRPHRCVRMPDVLRRCSWRAQTSSHDRL